MERRELIKYLELAKKAETRLKRIEFIIERVAKWKRK